MRGVFEQLGFIVSWNGDLRQATLTNDNFSVILTIGSDIFTTNGINHTLDVPAQIVSGSTMLPIRAVLESVGYYLDWDSATRTVLITTAPPVADDWPATRADIQAIVLNGQQLTDQQIIDVTVDASGHVMIPVSLLALMGFEAQHTPSATAITFYWSNRLNSIVITTGQANATLNQGGQTTTITLTTPAIVHGGRTVFPLADFANARGMTLSWNAATGVLTIEAGTAIPQAPGAYLTNPIVWSSPTLLTSAEIDELIARAPVRENTRSAMTITSTPFTDAELAAWRAEYFALGGMNAQELSHLRAINEARAGYGRAPLLICTDMSMAARFAAQGNSQMGVGTAHNLPGYGSLSAIARLFGTGGLSLVGVSQAGDGPNHTRFGFTIGGQHYDQLVGNPNAQGGFPERIGIGIYFPEGANSGRLIVLWA